jgi:hypothetical protein
MASAAASRFKARESMIIPVLRGFEFSTGQSILAIGAILLFCFFKN